MTAPVLACRIIETDEFARWCRRCGGEAAPRDSVTRRLAHEPLGWRPTTLLITMIRQVRAARRGGVTRGDSPEDLSDGCAIGDVPKEAAGDLAAWPELGQGSLMDATECEAGSGRISRPPTRRRNERQPGRCRRFAISAD